MIRQTLPLAAVAMLLPATAFASEGAGASPASWALGAATLVAAVVLLALAISLARVAEGSAVSENVWYVVAAAACLAGSVLAGWAAQLMTTPASSAAVALGGQALDLAGVALLCVYFLRVRSALRRFLVRPAAGGPHGGSGDAADA